MISEKQKNLSDNLKNLRSALSLSLTEFSEELHIPKTTLQSVMDGGHTTLYTALHISEQLDIPLDTLTNGCLSPGQIRRLDGSMSQLAWFDKLPKEKQTDVCSLLMALLQYMQGEYDA